MAVWFFIWSTERYDIWVDMPNCGLIGREGKKKMTLTDEDAFKMGEWFDEIKFTYLDYSISSQGYPRKAKCIEVTHEPDYFLTRFKNWLTTAEAERAIMDRLGEDDLVTRCLPIMATPIVYFSILEPPYAGAAKWKGEAPTRQEALINAVREMIKDG